MRQCGSRALAGILLSLLATLLFANACDSVQGTTPTCKQDVDEHGNQRLDGGCNTFATCRNDAGALMPPEKCCEGRDGGELQLCLYGYGAADAPISLTGSTTTASTTGTGGAAAGGAGGS